MHMSPFRVLVLTLVALLHTISANPLPTSTCTSTCNDDHDKQWVEALQLKTCSSPNPLTLLEVLGKYTLEKVATQFKIKPLSEAQATCMLTNKKHAAAQNNLVSPIKCIPEFS